MVLAEPWRERVRSAGIVLLLVSLPLENALVISTSFRIPPYVILFPAIALAAVVAGGGLAPLKGPFGIAVAVWLSVSALSLVMWVIDPPPTAQIAESYGSLRASEARGVFQLAITVGFAAALPATVMLARRRLTQATGVFLAISALVAIYALWQVYGNQYGFWTPNISNDPLTRGRALTAWRGIIRARGTFGEPAGLGQFLIGATPLALALAVWPPRPWVRPAAAAVAALTWAGVIMSLAVGPWLGILPVLIVGAVAFAHRRAWRAAALTSVTLPLVAVLAIAPAVTRGGGTLVAINTTEASPTQPAATNTTGSTRSKPKLEPTTSTDTTPPTPGVTTPPENTSGVRVGDGKGASGILDVPSVLFNRVADRITSSSGDPDRKVILETQFRLWREHPVLGAGIGAADPHLSVALNSGSLPSTQGVWWASLSETGTLGLLALLAVVATFVFELARGMRAGRRSPWYPIVVGSLAGVLGQLAAYVAFGERIGPHVWVLMGLGLLAAHSMRTYAKPM